MNLYKQCMETMAVTCVALISYASPSLADAGLPVPFYLAAPEIFLLVCASIAYLLVMVPVEYVVVYCFLGRPVKARGQIFMWVLLANFITQLGAQLGMLFLADPVQRKPLALVAAMFGTIELMTVIVQFALFKWMVGRLHRRGVIQEAFSTLRTFAMALVAYLASRVVAFACTGLFLKIHDKFLL